MANFRDKFPSRFMQSADLDNGPVDVTIAEIADENLGSEDSPRLKPVASFEEEGSKPCVLNITRCESIADIVGSDDMDRWLGHRIRLMKGKTNYKGKRVPCIDVTAPPVCTAPGFLDSGLTVFASTLPRPARRGRVAPGRGFDSRISPASTVRCMSA